QICRVVDRADAVTCFELTAKRGDVPAFVESAQHEMASGCRKAMSGGEAEATYGSSDEGVFSSERAHVGGCYSIARLCGGLRRRSRRKIRPVCSETTLP